MTDQSELARELLKTHREELQTLKDVGAIQGYAAEDEIEEAINHLDAAIVDLDQPYHE